MPDRTPADKLERWEETFAAGLVANSREQAEPWLAGHVHVVCDLPPQLEPVRTEHGPRHSFILFTEQARRVEDRTEGGPVHYNAARPGDLHVYSRARNGEPHLSRWMDSNSFLSVAVEPHAVREACRAADLDYDRTEFVDRFPAKDPLLERLIRQLGRELQAGAPGGRLYAEQLMQTVALHLVRHHTSEEHRVPSYTGGVPPARLKRVEAYVEAHLSEEIRLEDLADEAGMSQYHFCRQFKKTVGQSPYQYVIERRVEEGRRLLKETGWTVARVSLAVGYESQSRFTQQFKRRVGTTPGRFRRERT